MTVSYFVGDERHIRSVATQGGHHAFSPRTALDADAGCVDPFPSPLTASDIARMHSGEDCGRDCGLAATAADADAYHPGLAPFPHPPTLADIYRMEPDLSPLSMRRRASDCGYDEPVFRSFPCGYSRGAFDEVIEEASPLLSGYCDEVSPDDYQAFSLPTIDDFDPKEEQRIVLSSIAEWISDYMYEMACSGRIPNPFQAPISALPFSRTLNVQRITNILLSTLMPTSVPFLALVYVNRIVDKVSRRLVRAPHDAGVKAFICALTTGSSLTVDTLITRYLMVGLMLADKWLDDHSFAVRTWRDVSHISARVLHTMEMAALQIFNYHLQIPQNKWVDYLERLRGANELMLASQLSSTILPPCAIVHLVLRDLIDASHAAQAEVEPQYLEHTRIAPPPPPPRALPKISALQDSWERYQSVRRAHNSYATSLGKHARALSPPRVSSLNKRKLSPSEWSPEQDAIVAKARRTMSGMAVGAERSIRREFSDWVDVGLVTKKILNSGNESHARAVSISGVPAPRNAYADVLGYRNRPVPPIKSIEPLRVINI
jgi:hypothetical protein